MGTGKAKSEKFGSSINPDIGDSDYEKDRFIVFKPEEQDRYEEDLQKDYAHCYRTDTGYLLQDDYNGIDVPEDFNEDLKYLNDRGIDVIIPGANDDYELGDAVVDVEKYLRSQGQNAGAVSHLSEYLRELNGYEDEEYYGEYIPIKGTNIINKFLHNYSMFNKYMEGDDSYESFYNGLTASQKRALTFVDTLDDDLFNGIIHRLQNSHIDSNSGYDVLTTSGRINTRIGVRTIRKLIEAFEKSELGSSSNTGNFSANSECFPLGTISFYPVTGSKSENDGTLAYYSNLYLASFKADEVVMGKYKSPYSHIQFTGSSMGNSVDPYDKNLNHQTPHYNTGEDLKSTSAHEFGHYVDYHLFPKIEDFRPGKYYSKDIQGSQAVSPYGNKNEKEAFAEAFTCYTTGRTPWQGQEYYKNFCNFMQENGLSSFKDCLKGEMF